MIVRLTTVERRLGNSLSSQSRVPVPVDQKAAASLPTANKSLSPLATGLRGTYSTRKAGPPISSSPSSNMSCDSCLKRPEDQKDTDLKFIKFFAVLLKRHEDSSVPLQIERANEAAIPYAHRLSCERLACLLLRLLNLSRMSLASAWFNSFPSCNMQRTTYEYSMHLIDVSRAMEVVSPRNWYVDGGTAGSRSRYPWPSRYSIQYSNP